jgi:hypothetical protein
MIEETPKRPRGRPRKDAPPYVYQPVEQPKHAKPAGPVDPRIGEEVDATTKFITFPDGAEYRAENGRLVERVN